ncbi:MAG TPA: hypothetical protein VII53_07750 [Solirubrobacteraceae bacterium]
MLASLTVNALPAAAAQGAPVASTCPAVTLSQPFLKWGDSSSYQLVAGGSFEGSLVGWTLSGGAQKVAGSEPYGATGTVGSYSLGLPAGASAQSPFTCVEASYKTFRFFARNTGAASKVLVHVTYQTPIGLVSIPVGTVTLTNGWQPTPAMPTGAEVAGGLLGGTAQMALTFTAVTGNSVIDDVFVDPRMR